jgi:hypothetical protein
MTCLIIVTTTRTDNGGDRRLQNYGAGRPRPDVRRVRQIGDSS